MELNKIHTEDCLVTMSDHIDEKSVDIVLTSPPYCTCNRGGKNSKNNLTNETHSNSKFYPTMRYDVFNDNMSEEEYIDWTIKLFNSFDRILKKDGCILYNISYSSTRRDMLFLTIAAILQKTNFSLADMIIWKKRTALPNNTSPNKLTRIVEPVFVFARRDDMDTFICNKKVVSVRERTGQKMYENVYNFLEAPNNDGMCKLNRATYSSELCEKLLNLYGKSGMTVYDPFMGTGTTAVACKRLGMNYIGSELSHGQTDFANNRIANDSGIPGDYDSNTDSDESSDEQPNDEIQEQKPKKRRGRKPKAQKDESTVTTNFVQMEMFNTIDSPTEEFAESVMDGIKQTQSTTKNEMESETVSAVDESEFSDTTFPTTTVEGESKYDSKEAEDDKNEKDEFEKELDECKKEEGYVLNGYFHSYSTCPVGEDEFS
jgi:DNA modification methylase